MLLNLRPLLEPKPVHHGFGYRDPFAQPAVVRGSSRVAVRVGATGAPRRLHASSRVTVPVAVSGRLFDDHEVLWLLGVLPTEEGG